MSPKNPDIRLLEGEIAKGRDVLRRLGGGLREFETKKIIGGKPALEEAMIVAQYLSNYYTCCETVFLRISGGGRGRLSEKNRLSPHFFLFKPPGNLQSRRFSLRKSVPPCHEF